MNAGAAKENSLVIWHISDYRAGHDNQCAGLIQSLKRLRDCRCHRLQYAGKTRLILPFITRSYPGQENLPCPDLVIGAGHSTHLSLLCAGRAFQAKTIVIMKPGLPTGWFDLCLIPAHDSPVMADSNNIIVTDGVLNRITPSSDHDDKKGLILVGGISRHFDWRQELITTQIERLTGNEDIQWIITDSPRTPGETRDFLNSINKHNVRYSAHAETGEDWLPDQLSKAGNVWVSEDSMSMLYEALTSGAGVGVLDVPAKRTGRLTNVKNQLVSRGLVTSFKQWSQGKPLTPSPQVLNESTRCAKLVLEKFSL